MYRLLIVDDEPDVLQALYDMLLDHESLDLDVLKAGSAWEALEILNRERLDIVLSDICMPGMDGLELLRRVRENWPDCRMIFLTGHTEFTYIYQAEKLEAVSYILKTEGRQKIIEAITKAIEQIRARNSLADLEKAMISQKASDRPYLLRELTESLISGDRTASLCLALAQLCPGLDVNRPLLVAAASINGAEKPDLLDKSRFFMILEERCAHHLGRHFRVVLGETTRWKILFLIQPTREPADWNRLAHLARGSFEAIQSVCMEEHNIYLSVILDTQSRSIWSVRQAYEKLTAILNESMNYGAGIRLVSMSDEPQGSLTDEIQAVAMVRTIMEEHYDKPLSLTYLASQVYLNPSYLSRLFKRQTGMTLIGFLSQTRLEKARDLLMTTNMKVSDVAARAGYESPSYFNQAFKKATGLSPMDFRAGRQPGESVK
jgi:two-component system response regulator YesN